MVTTISDDHVTMLASEPNITLAGVVLYEIYACPWKNTNEKISHLMLFNKDQIKDFKKMTMTMYFYLKKNGV